LKFVDIIKGGKVLFSAAEQAEAFDAFIEKDAYLSANRGKYAQRNGALLPLLNRFDLSVVHEYKIKIATKTTILQARIDILNVGNLMKNTWGVGYTLRNFDAFRSAAAILSVPLDENGKANIAKQTDKEMQVQMIPVNGTLDYDLVTKSAYSSDVWQAQVGLRWSF
jgi:hypothetical protein